MLNTLTGSSKGSKIMKYYVYVLTDGGIPFYVGKGTKLRMLAHEYRANNKKLKSFVLSKIRKMKSVGQPIGKLKVFESDSPELCFAEEIRLIAFYGRRDKGLGPLCNLTDGGEGTMGHIVTDVQKKKVSNSLNIAYSEGRTGLQKAWEASKNPDAKETHRAAMLAMYQSSKGEELKQHKKEIGKSKLVNGKRVLSDEARLRMRESALRTNELRKTKT